MPLKVAKNNKFVKYTGQKFVTFSGKQENDKLGFVIKVICRFMHLFDKFLTNEYLSSIYFCPLLLTRCLSACEFSELHTSHNCWLGDSLSIWNVSYNFSLVWCEVSQIDIPFCIWCLKWQILEAFKLCVNFGKCFFSFSEVLARELTDNPKEKNQCKWT